ncbi:hypothetical protein [Clavibacter tessellarius]|uniref:hypothetical protein n=1 Tax=Clavibacter tessellarius TaxID=31965 RepID=UPI0032529F77
MVAVEPVAEDARAVLEEGGDRDVGELGSGVDEARARAGRAGRRGGGRPARRAGGSRSP